MSVATLFGLCLIAPATAMAPCILLNDGYKIPMVALGTARGTSVNAPVPGDEVRDAVYWAIEAGYRHIDTASIYGNELLVGKGIAQAIQQGLVTREDLFVTTKLWNDKHAEDQVIPQLQESLKQLGLDYVDLYLVHYPLATKDDDSPSDIDYLETWQGMEQAKQLGLARSIGVSNFNVLQISRLYDNARIKPAVNEIEVNPTLTQVPLVTQCQQLGVTVMAYSPFGFLVDRERESIPPKHDDPTLVAMANKYGKTTLQIVLRYLVERDLIPIPKSTNKGRLAQNIDIFDFQLTPEEVATISAFNKNIRVIEMKDYEHYPNFPFAEY